MRNGVTCVGEEKCLKTTHKLQKRLLHPFPHIEARVPYSQKGPRLSSFLSSFLSSSFSKGAQSECFIFCESSLRELRLYFFFIDKDECMMSNNICGYGTCENVPGSYRCVCAQGYKFDENTKKCVGKCNCVGGLFVMFVKGI